MTRISRRAFLRLAARTTVLAAVAPVAAAAYGFGLEPYRLAAERVVVRSVRVPRGLDGLTIGHLSDIHRGPYIDEAFIGRAARMLLAMSPQLIVLTGDYVHRDGSPASAARALSALSAPLGIYAVLGNHDHWSGAAAVERAFQSAFNGLPFEWLHNRSRAIKVNGTPLHIVGVDDAWAGSMDLRRALTGVPRGEPSLLLVHEPDVADQASAMHPFILQLSGHTHGGQVRIPVLGAPVLPYLGHKYPIGLSQAAGMFVYTSRGVGMATPPVRFHCPPEVALVTLRAA